MKVKKSLFRNSLEKLLISVSCISMENFVRKFLARGPKATRPMADLGVTSAGLFQLRIF